MSRTRRITATVLFVVLTVSLVGAAPLAAQDDCPVKIGLVTDVGRLRDQSFNESAWVGIERAAETLGMGTECYSYIETQDTADYIPNIALLIDEGYGIIVTSGYLMTEATRQAGLMYPDVYFIGTDQGQVNENFEYDPIPNVAGLVFYEDHAAFLAGALAAALSESGVIGGVYGTDVVPPVVRLREGFEMGARYVNPDIRVLGAYHPGTPDVAFIDIRWGGDTARTMIAEGADVIYGAGGQTGNGGLIAACNAGLPVIGVDVDQYYTLPEVQPCIVTSATKDLVNGVHDLIVAAVRDGEYRGGAVEGPAVLAPFHEWEDKIPDDVKAMLDEILAGIESGEIETCPVDDPDIGWNCDIAGLSRPGEVNVTAVIEASCVTCHDTGVLVENIGQSEEWWKDTIERMAAMGGLELTEAEVNALVTCLHTGACTIPGQ